KTIFIAERDSPEVTSVDVRNSVMPRQLLVDESLIRREQTDDAAVFFQLRVEKQLDLFHESSAQIVVEPGKLGALRIQQPHIANLQPFCKEIPHQRATGARIGEQARDLLLENRRLAQFPADRQVEKRIVGDAAPQ